MNCDYTIKNELTFEQLDQLHALSRQMWWSKDRTKEEIATMLKHCIPFAVIDISSQKLVGFARVLTDEIRYAYIYDVMTEEELRGRGIGKMIMQTVLNHPTLLRVKYFELTCAPELVEFYKASGFSTSFLNVVPMRYISNK